MVSFKVKDLREVLETEIGRREAERDKRIQQLEEQEIAEAKDWLREKRRRITDTIDNLHSVTQMDDDAFIEQLEEYGRLARSLPTYSPNHRTQSEIRRIKDQNPTQELRTLLTTLSVVADETISVNALERLGFKRDDMRTVVRLLAPAPPKDGK